MSTVIRRCAVIAAAGALLLSGTATATADPAGTTAVSATAASHRADQIALLSGDQQWLVYAETPTLGDGTVDPDSADVVATNGTASTTLGTLPRDFDGDLSTSFTVNGSIVTTLGDAFVQPNNFESLVSWWNLGTHTSGTADLGLSVVFIGASPDGWLYADGDTLFDESTDGTVRVVKRGVPFGAASTIVSGSAGPAGVVLVSASNKVTYVSFAGEAQRLDLNRKSPGYHYIAQCGAVTATDAICADEPELQVSDLRKARSSVQLVASELPLDGSTALSVPDSCAGTGVTYDDDDYTNTPGAISGAVAGKRLICADSFVSSRSTPTARVHTSTYRVGRSYFDGGPSILRSLGHTVVTNPAHNVLETVTSASQPPKPLLPRQPSPVTVGAFSLSPGQVAWVSDPSASATGTENTMSDATLGVSAGNLSLGATHRLAAGVGWTLGARSGQNSVYEVQKTIDGAKTTVVDAVSPYRTTTITNIKPARISLSGNRMLYLTTPESGAPRGRYLLLNLDTGTTTRVGALEGWDDPAGLAPQLWGSEVLFRPPGSSLSLHNLTTGKSTHIPTPAGFAADASYFRPLIYGSEVAGEATRPNGEIDGVLLNLNHLHSPVVLASDEFVYQLSNDGAVVYPFVTYQPEPLSLRGYGASDAGTPLGIDATDVSTPHLDSGVLAWRTPDYQLDATTVTDKPLTPLYLGAGYAPATLASKATWSFSLPYSAPLASCQLVISKNSTMIRTLACSAAAMRLGVAGGSWDGTNGSGQTAPSGAYTWTTTVSGTSGTTDTRTGTVTVR